MRLYDANTFQCFVSSDARDQHSSAINSVCVSCNLICSSCDHHVICYRYIILWMVRLTSRLVKMEAKGKN